MRLVVRRDGVCRPPIREFGFVQGILLPVVIAVLIVKIVLLLVVNTVKVELTVVRISVSLFQ